MNLQIRALSDLDRDQWQALYYGYLDFYESEPIEPATEILWKRLTSAKPEIQSYVIDINGELAGFVHFHYQLSTWSHTFHCYLEDLFVAETHRGQGYAEKLISEVKRAARETKCSELFWITKKSNARARSVYDKIAKESDFVRYEVLLEEND